MSKKASRRDFIKGTSLMVGGVLGTGVMGSPVLVEAQQGSTGASGSTSRGAQVRALLANGEPLLIPHVNNVFIARLAEVEGYTALRVGGSVVASSAHGLPNMGIVSIKEQIDFAGSIATQTNLPVVADGDDGGPSAVHVYRATKGFETAGVAAVVFSDAVQVRVGRNSGLVTKEDMVNKVKAAVEARRDPNFVLIIRNDSLSEGQTMEQAFERGVAYAAAGADMLQFSGLSLKDHAKARDVVGKPLLTSARPTVSPAQLKAFKISMIFYHVERVGYGAVLQALREWKTTGMVVNATKMEISDEAFSRAVEADRYRALGKKYGLK